MAPEGEASTHVRGGRRPPASAGVPGTARPGWGGAARLSHRVSIVPRSLRRRLGHLGGFAGGVSISLPAGTLPEGSKGLGAEAGGGVGAEG